MGREVTCVHDLPLLVNLSVALAVALAAGLLARRLGLPALVGYLLAGIAIGPSTPGFVGDAAAIAQLAELGVVLLLFGVGLHFSLRDLWRVRDVAVPGALGQMALATVLGFLLARAWGWSQASALVLGLSLSVASTVVLLRGLMERGWLHTRAGRVAVGWLVLEDLATVLLLLVLPALAPAPQGLDLRALGLTLAGALGFVAFMLLLGVRVVPALLLRVASTRSRELFLLAALTLALGTALGSAALFGVSLALGAFLAGVVVGESPLSHQVGADLLPFRDAFAVLFFVSAGMLVDPFFVAAHAGQVLALAALVVGGKALGALALCLLLRQPVRTGLVVAAGLGQMGEFSFILGQAGVRLGLLSNAQYALILAASLASILVNPLLFRLIAPLERVLGRGRLGRRQGVGDPAQVPELSGHVVIVGCGRVGGHVLRVLGQLGAPRLVIEYDPDQLVPLAAEGVPLLYGDAANAEILAHARLPQARALVVTIPDEDAAGLVVSGARALAPELPIIVRAASSEGRGRLARLGARVVIHPEFEGALEVLRHTLLELGFTVRAVHGYTDALRRESYDTLAPEHAEYRALGQLLDATRALEISFTRLGPESPFVGQTLARLELRARSGASVVAVERDGALVPNPPPDWPLLAGDRLGLFGDARQVQTAQRLLGWGAEPSRD